MGDVCVAVVETGKAMDRGNGYPAAPDTSVCVVVGRRWREGVGGWGGQRQWVPAAPDTSVLCSCWEEVEGGGGEDRGSGYPAAPDTSVCVVCC